jgi:hypothetical protein
MNLFQIVFVIFCAVQAAFSLMRFARTRQTTALLFLAAWIVAIGLILYPGISTQVAHTVGIGRGVDFVTYSLLVAFLWAHYQQYLRYKRVENEVTLLVRELAIAHSAQSAGVTVGSGRSIDPAAATNV